MRKKSYFNELHREKMETFFHFIEEIDHRIENLQSFVRDILNKNPIN